MQSSLVEAKPEIFFILKIIEVVYAQLKQLAFCKMECMLIIFDYLIWSDNNRNCEYTIQAFNIFAMLNYGLIRDQSIIGKKCFDIIHSNTKQKIKTKTLSSVVLMQWIRLCTIAENECYSNYHFEIEEKKNIKIKMNFPLKMLMCFFLSVSKRKSIEIITPMNRVFV